jgi:hypothetical protein
MSDKAPFGAPFTLYQDCGGHGLCHTRRPLSSPDTRCQRIDLRPAKRLREWTQLKALCTSGLDPISLAPDAFEHVHQLVPNAACALFLTAPNGIPQRFLHEDSPDHVKALFQNEFHLFLGPQEINVVQIVTAPQAQKAGRLLSPPRDYFRSNTYQMLVRGSGHHHALDVRLQHQQQGLGALMLFREEGAAFRQADLDKLKRVASLFEHALAVDPIEWAPWDHGASDDALIVTHADARVAWISPPAATLLRLVPLVGQAWQGQHLPQALQQLIWSLRGQGPLCDRAPLVRIAVADGWLQAHAQWLHTPGQHDLAAPEAMVGLMLKRIVPRQLRFWRALTKVDLSPRSFEVAFALATGASAQAARQRLGLSESVWKDCVKSIYQVFDVNSHNGLVERIQQLA